MNRGSARRDGRRTSLVVRPGSGNARSDSGRGTWLLAAMVVPFLAMLAVRSWLVEPFTVAADSMSPAIPSGSIVFVYNPAAAMGLIRNGMVVAFTSPVDGRTVIKRVIAGEGQRVAIRDSELFVDDVAVSEPFVDHSRIDATYFGPETVPPGRVFVLGDNRAVSIDSRDFGALPLSAIQGSVLTGHQ